VLVHADHARHHGSSSEVCDERAWRNLHVLSVPDRSDPSLLNDDGLVVLAGRTGAVDDPHVSHHLR